MASINRNYLNFSHTCCSHNYAEILFVVKVRNLEAQNRHLADELDKLTSKWGRETSQIKAMYQAELDDARHALDDAEKEKARLEIRVSTFEELIEELQTKWLGFLFIHLLCVN